jgi:membrane protease YdiL (CAAX protease family)
MPAPDQPRFNAGLALVAWLFAFTGGVLGATIITAAAGYAGKRANELPLWLIAVQEIPLWAGLLGASVVVSRNWGTGSVKRDFGISFRRVDLWGIPVGAVTQLVFVSLLYKALSVVINTKSLEDPARELTSKARDPLGVVLLVLVIAVGAPIVEEIFFRGLVQRSIAARYSDTVALVGSAVMFGLVHFQPLQFPGLLLFGLVAGYCAQRTRRLGMSMLAHMAFNGVSLAVLLARH